MIGPERITLGILAGGRASRLAGADKALLRFDGQTLLQRTLHAFPDCYAERLLSYNRRFDASLSAELRIVPDLRPGFPGPLAALEALSAVCRTPWLLTTPVDCRQIPDSLPTSLAQAIGNDGTVLRDADGLQPLLGIWRVVALRPAIEAAFAAGELAMRQLIVRLDLKIHDISPRRMGNLNTPNDFSTP